MSGPCAWHLPSPVLILLLQCWAALTAAVCTNLGGAGVADFTCATGSIAAAAAAGGAPDPDEGDSLARLGAIAAMRRRRVPASCSYGELAAATLPAALDATLELLPALNTTTRSQDVKPLRLSVLDAKNLLDVMVFAYPTEWCPPLQPKPLDVWRLARGVLDEGYETLGTLQDLSHSGVAYNTSDEARAVLGCLGWKAHLEHDVVAYSVRDYLAHPSPSELYQRPGGWW